MDIAYRALEDVHEWFITIDGTTWQIRTRRTIENFQEQGECQGEDEKPKPLERIEILPVYHDPFVDYNYSQLEREEIPKNLIPISWHELPFTVKQQIVQLEENESVGVYDPQRPAMLFTG